MVVMAMTKTIVSVIASNRFAKFNGIFATRSSLLFSSFSELRNRIREPKTILAPFHSTCSNLEPLFDHPRFMIEKITNLDDAHKLFDEMTQRQPLPYVVEFNQLLTAVTKMKQYSCTIDLFKQMVMIGVPIDVYTTNIVIKCCCQMYNTNEGFAILACGFKRAVVPDACTFSTLLNGLVMEDRVLEAERLFKKLIQDELCEPTVLFCTTMIKGLCKTGNNDPAIALLRLTDERGYKPTVVTYNTIIDSLCKDEMVDDALDLFNEMISHKGILPNVITYSSLIRGLCNLGRWDDASKMLIEMEEEGISPNVITFNILVDALCKVGYMDDAEGVINIMIHRGKDPDVVTFSSLVNGYCLQGEMSKARNVLVLMKSRGLVPNVVTYNSLLNGYCSKLMLDEAMHLFSEMTEKGMKPDVIICSTMLQGLFRAGRCEAACRFFNKMREHNQFSDECSRIILEGLCNNHQIDEAISLFRTMGDNKLNLDTDVYDVLVDGASKFEKLRVLFSDLSVLKDCNGEGRVVS